MMNLVGHSFELHIIIRKKQSNSIWIRLIPSDLGDWFRIEVQWMGHENPSKIGRLSDWPSFTVCEFQFSKLTGMAFRVPTPDVSVVDLTVRLEKGVSMKSWNGFKNIEKKRRNLNSFLSEEFSKCGLGSSSCQVWPKNKDYIFSNQRVK